MRVLITGGSGFIGRHAAAALSAAGHRVETPGRRELDLAAGDAGALRARLEGVEVLINCAGLVSGRGAMEAVHAAGTARLLEAAAGAGVRRFLHISALGATAGGVTDYQRSKGAAEELIRAHPEGRAPECCVLRPSLVIGRGGASTAMLAALAALPVTPLIGGGDVQPIHVRDLAALIVRLVEAPEPPPRFLDVTGPEPMSIDALADALRRWMRLPRRPAVRIPAPLLGAAAIAGGITGGPLNRETLTMLREGNTASPAPLTAILGRPPLGLDTALALDPADRADRQTARLYFLRPLLRICLALMWIITGLVSLGLYPVAKSYDLMAEIGLTGLPAGVALYGAGALDLILGVLLLLRWRPVLVGAAQLAAMAAFTLLAAGLPAEYWLHPFAPLVKNLPIAAATLVMMSLED